MILKFDMKKQKTAQKPQTSQHEVCIYIKDMLEDLSMVAGGSGLQDIQAFLSVTHQAVQDAAERYSAKT